MLQRISVTTAGVGHAVLQVADLDVAVGFYHEVLGFAVDGRDLWPACGKSAGLSAPSGQALVLAEEPLRNDPSASAAHCAFRVSPVARARILDAVRAPGGAVHDYREDRPSEAADNVYFADPSGNRVQLVARDGGAASGIQGVDHVGLEVNDILWSETFYGDWLGWEIEHRVGWNTRDYLNAKQRGEAGMREAMPGSRYWNERYSQFETERKALRPNPQLYFGAGAGTSIAVYLASRHYQAPPDDARAGAPRLGIRIPKGRLDDVARMLETHRMPFEGPVRHAAGVPVAASIYMREPGGNFLEFAEAR